MNPQFKTVTLNIQWNKLNIKFNNMNKLLKNQIDHK